MCGIKYLILREMLNIGLKVILHVCLTVVGVRMVASDANVCAADPKRCIR